VKLTDAGNRAKAEMEALKQQTDAKIKPMQDQAAKKADAKAKIEQHIAEIRADRDQRTSKRKQACAVTRVVIGGTKPTGGEGGYGGNTARGNDGDIAGSGADHARCFPGRAGRGVRRDSAAAGFPVPQPACCVGASQRSSSR